MLESNSSLQQPRRWAEGLEVGLEGDVPRLHAIRKPLQLHARVGDGRDDPFGRDIGRPVHRGHRKETSQGLRIFKSMTRILIETITAPPRVTTIPRGGVVGCSQLSGYKGGANSPCGPLGEYREKRQLPGGQNDGITTPD